MYAMPAKQFPKTTYLTKWAAPVSTFTLLFHHFFLSLSCRKLSMALAAKRQAHFACCLFILKLLLWNCDTDLLVLPNFPSLICGHGSHYFTSCFFFFFFKLLLSLLTVLHCILGSTFSWSKPYVCWPWSRHIFSLWLARFGFGKVIKAWI